MKNLILSVLLLLPAASAMADIVSSDANGQISVQTVRADNLCINDSGAGSCGTLRAGIGVSGRVGVNTLTPATELDVNGTLTVTSITVQGITNTGGETLASLHVTGDTTLDSTATIVGNAFSVGGSSLVVAGGNVSAGGSLGVGATTTPTDNITVFGGSGNARARFNREGTDVLLVGTDSTADAVIDTLTNGYLRFLTNNAEVMRLTAGGNVGIGTTAPGSKLQLNAPAQDVSRMLLTLANTDGTNPVGIGYNADSPDYSMTFVVKGSTAITAASNGGVNIGAGYKNNTPNVNGLNVQGAFTVGSSTLSARTDGMVLISQFSSAKINTQVTPVAGGYLTCTDCTVPYSLCVGTGTVIGQFRRVGATDGCY